MSILYYFFILSKHLIHIRLQKVIMKKRINCRNCSFFRLCVLNQHSIHNRLQLVLLYLINEMANFLFMFYTILFFITYDVSRWQNLLIVFLNGLVSCISIQARKTSENETDNQPIRYVNDTRCPVNIKIVKNIIEGKPRKISVVNMSRSLLMTVRFLRLCLDRRRCLQRNGFA